MTLTVTLTLPEALSKLGESRLHLSWPGQVSQDINRGLQEAGRSLLEAELGEGPIEVSSEATGFMYCPIGVSGVRPQALHGELGDPLDLHTSRHLFFGPDGF